MTDLVPMPIGSACVSACRTENYTPSQQLQIHMLNIYHNMYCISNADFVSMHVRSNFMYSKNREVCFLKVYFSYFEAERS